MANDDLMAAIRVDVPVVLEEIARLDLLSDGVFMPQAVAFAFLVSSMRVCLGHGGDREAFDNMIDAAWFVAKRKINGS